MIEEQYDLKGKKSFDIFTKTQEGQIVAKKTIKKLEGNVFSTEVHANVKNPDLVEILTKNDKNEEISRVTLRPIFHSISDSDYLKNFELQKKKTTVIKLQQ